MVSDIVTFFIKVQPAKSHGEITSTVSHKINNVPLLLQNLGFTQGFKVGTLGRQNERNSSYVRLAHTSITGLYFMPACLMKSNCYSLIYSSLSKYEKIGVQSRFCKRRGTLFIFLLSWMTVELLSPWRLAGCSSMKNKSHKMPLILQILGCSSMFGLVLGRSH